MALRTGGVPAATHRRYLPATATQRSELRETRVVGRDGPRTGSCLPPDALERWPPSSPRPLSEPPPLPLLEAYRLLATGRLGESLLVLGLWGAKRFPIHAQPLEPVIETF